MKGFRKKNYVVIIHGLPEDRKGLTLRDIFQLIRLVTRRKNNKMLVTGWTADDAYLFSYKTKPSKQEEIQKLLKTHYPDLNFTYLSK